MVEKKNSWFSLRPAIIMTLVMTNGPVVSVQSARAAAACILNNLQQCIIYNEDVCLLVDDVNAFVKMVWASDWCNS
eukprot:5687316-Amphidinium_carterae.1